MNIFNRIYSFIQRDSIIAKASLNLSYREINNVCLKARPHYVSSKKAAVFLEAIGKKVVINEKMTTAGEVGAGIDNIIKLTGKASQEVVYENNVYKAIKESIQIAVDKDIIVPYEKSDRGKYILIHFPFFNGTMELKCCKKYKDVYWWCGIYRDLAIYACGNKKNRVDDADSIDNSLWDPSGSYSSLEFFDKINTYVLKDDSDLIENEEQFFEQLASAIHDGTMRGSKKDKYHGWYEMLLRCDRVERKDGCIKIFGSPVLVTYETDPGYGWYLLSGNIYDQYYREWNGEWNQHYFKSSSRNDYDYYKEENVKKQMDAGFDFGYCINKKNHGYKLRVTHEIKRMQKEDINKLKNIREEDTPQGIEDIKSVCYTTSEVRKNIRR